MGLFDREGSDIRIRRQIRGAAARLVVTYVIRAVITILHLRAVAGAASAFWNPDIRISAQVRDCSGAEGWTPTGAMFTWPPAACAKLRAIADHGEMAAEPSHPVEGCRAE